MELLVLALTALGLLYLPACILVANVAAWRGLNSFGWFFAALVCTPLMAMLGAMAMPEGFDSDAARAARERTQSRPA